MRQTLLILALALAVAAPAAAQQLTVVFNDGLVTVDAASVPVRTILNEWAKKGGTKVVGAERISGAPLTIKLIDVPEAQALEVILRSVAGYMAAPRHTGEGASRYDRILVMATSAAPAPAASRVRLPPNPAAMRGTQRFVPPRRQAVNDEPDVDDEEEEDPNPPNPPVFTFPQQGNGQAQPGIFGNVPPGSNGQPVITLNPATGEPQSITINPSQQAPGAPQMPIGSATPGMISAPPPQPGAPGAVVRRPGGGD
jgi:hypothetical protein